MPATIKNHLSPADLICARRFSATNVADMNPAAPATTHLNISSGTTDIHRAGIKTNREYPYRQNSCTRPAGAEKYLRITYRQRGTMVT
uniref:Uncharacterized protein n=1 Tax=Glycine max TaxID=3847 RepID=C6TKM7_SOYBN|nr:unknown [Glycine max]